MKRGAAIIALAVMAVPAVAPATDWAGPKPIDGYLLEQDGRYAGFVPAGPGAGQGHVRVEMMNFYRIDRWHLPGPKVEAISQVLDVDCRTLDYVTITNVHYAKDGRRSPQSPVNAANRRGPLDPMLRRVCDGSYRSTAQRRFRSIAEFLAIRDQIADQRPSVPKATARILLPSK